MVTKRNYDEYIEPCTSNVIRINNTRRNVYTLYSIVPIKSTEGSATYKQVAKYYSENEICYKINQILKKKYDAQKEVYRYQLSYFEEAEEEDSFRRTQLKELIENTYISINFKQMMSLYKNNDALFYSNERLYDYLDSFDNFFIVESYIMQ